jgi:putative endonuclease
MTYYVYLLQTEHDTIYCGIAKDVEKRFQEHLTGVKNKGAKYTNANKPVKILYKCAYETKSLAMKEEARIKKLNRKEKNMLVKNAPLP